MKQILLATALIALPVAAFAAFTAYRVDTSVTASEGLGDLTPFITIVSDVQALAAGGNLAGATARIRDLEIAWDQAELALKPRDGARWHVIDGAADAALHALRATPQDPASIAQTLTGLRAALDPATPAATN